MAAGSRLWPQAVGYSLGIIRSYSLCPCHPGWHNARLCGVVVAWCARRVGFEFARVATRWRWGGCLVPTVAIIGGVQAVALVHPIGLQGVDICA